uniref:Smr domain-containing protein n=1 Tax=Elaeophora elaphi TaxID=1147741 RepID=A0A0R3RWH2_9BILA
MIFRYLNELVMELGELNDIEIEYPGLLVHIPILLTAELSKIWDLLYNEPFGNQMDSFENKWQSQTLEETNVTLQEKIALSKEQSADYGRRANSLRYSLLKRLENETSCQILIRGRGSLLNYRLESRLKNYAGWEHLSEPLHLLVRANDSTITLCLMKLARGVRHVKRYLARRQRNEMREK